MKIIRIVAIIGIAVFLISCGSSKNGLNVVNSGSFSEKNITLGGSIAQRLLTDSVVDIPEQNPLSIKLDEMILAAEKLRRDQSNDTWPTLSTSWDHFRTNYMGKDGLPADSMLKSEAMGVVGKWAELNIMLLKLSGEVRFGDVVENLLYKTEMPVLTEKQLKSIIYTHIDDQIFINVLGGSSFDYQHTTGGNVRLTQTTRYPLGSEIILSCEVGDVRYMDVFIRIPEWAVNPTVTHGNVKYVALPGEYCEIYRKWRNGDEFSIKLKN